MKIKLNFRGQILTSFDPVIIKAYRGLMKSNRDKNWLFCNKYLFDSEYGKINYQTLRSQAIRNEIRYYNFLKRFNMFKK